MSNSSAIFGASDFWPRMNGWNGWNRFSTASRVSRRCTRPFGVHEVVVEAGVDPRLEVLPAPVRVDVRRPRDRERMHAVLVLEHVRRVEAVLAARAGHEAVVAAVVACGSGRRARAAASSRSVQSIVPSLLLGEPAGVADALGVEVDRLLLARLRVLVLDGGVRPLVGDHAARAEFTSREGRT